MQKLPSIIEARKDAEEMIKGVVEGWDGHFGTYSRFYHIATEDSHTYINAMDSDFTTTFTVGSSGDQGIEASRRDAKDVYFFDINKSDIYFLTLKKVALSYLRRKDFLDFLIAENSGIIMEYNLYKKIEQQLPIPIRIFWERLYQFFQYNAYFMSEELFRSPRKHAKMARVVNGYYANNSTYYATQEKVKACRWHFIESDFYDLDKNLKDGVTFDSIILSNIYEYLNFGYETSAENAQKYIDFIKKVLLPRLKQNGKCMAAYLCRYNDAVDEFIQKRLEEDPNGWAPSEAILENLSNYEAGYTGQNVSYHYLLQGLAKEFPIQKIATRAGGYGQSFANEDMAVVIPKQKLLIPNTQMVK